MSIFDMFSKDNIDKRSKNKNTQIINPDTIKPSKEFLELFYPAEAEFRTYDTKYQDTWVCVWKDKDKNGVILNYRIKSQSAPEAINISPKELKEAILQNKVKIANLTLTSDNRLIDRANYWEVECIFTVDDVKGTVYTDGRYNKVVYEKENVKIGELIVDSNASIELLAPAYKLFTSNDLPIIEYNGVKFRVIDTFKFREFSVRLAAKLDENKGITYLCDCDNVHKNIIELANVDRFTWYMFGTQYRADKFNTVFQEEIIRAVGNSGEYGKCVYKAYQMNKSKGKDLYAEYTAPTTSGKTFVSSINR